MNRSRSCSSIHTQVLLYFLLAGLLPVVLLYLFTSTFTRNTLETTAYKKIEILTGEVCREISALMQNATADLRSLAANDFIFESHKNQEAWEEKLRRVHHFYHYFTDVTLYETNGAVVASTTYRFFETVEYTDWFDRAVAGDVAITRPHKVVGLPGLFLIVYFPVMGPDGKTARVISAGIEFDRVWEALDSIELGESGYYVLLDGYDNILSHPDKSLILEKFYNQYGESSWRNESNGFLTDRIGTKFMYSSRMLSRWDTRVGEPWTVVGLIPAAENLLVLRRQQDLQLNVGLIAILMTFLLGIRLSRMFAGPIADAAGAARKVREGTLDVRIPESGTSEVRDLANAFNEMVTELDAHRNHVKSLVDLQTEKLRRSEVSLREYAAELEQSNHELENFAYVASHDLQEPLRKVITFADRLQKNYETQLDDRGVDYLSRMQIASRRMQSLIQDLLAYSRLTTRAIPYEDVPLDQVVSDLLSDLEIPISESGATVVVDNLPVVKADALQMRQLIQNLLSNALKFKREGVAPKIRIRGRLEEANGSSPMHVLTVEDNGAGFDPQHADRIFDIFQRLHSHTEYEGTGIGLAICRKIVERHGGSIHASSSPENGTQFTVMLPVSKPAVSTGTGASPVTRSAQPV
jgi:signal transduction histidine kinase